MYAFKIEEVLFSIPRFYLNSTLVIKGINTLYMNLTLLSLEVLECRIFWKMFSNECLYIINFSFLNEINRSISKILHTTWFSNKSLHKYLTPIWNRMLLPICPMQNIPHGDQDIWFIAFQMTRMSQLWNNPSVFHVFAYTWLKSACISFIRRLSLLWPGQSGIFYVSNLLLLRLESSGELAEAQGAPYITITSMAMSLPV